MSKVIIHYFSGTGNTACAVNRINEHLGASGFEVKLWPIKKDVVPPTEPFDVHIIAFPILSWAAPVLVKRYIAKMPRSEGAKTALLAINGATFYKGEIVKGFTGQGLEQMELRLRRKNYDVFLTANASFPDNWTQATNPCTNEQNKEIFKLGETETDWFIGKFLDEKRELYRCGTFNKIWSYIVAGLFGKIGRRVLGKFYIADEHCTACGICAKACPVHTIQMNNAKPYWRSNCEDCNRCINICPEKAIQVSVPLFFLQVGINLSLTVWAIRLVLAYTPELIPLHPIVLAFLEIVLIVMAVVILLWVTLVPLDAFFRLLMRNRSVRKFFCFSYTRNYRRYTAPGFKPLK